MIYKLIKDHQVEIEVDISLVKDTIREGDPFELIFEKINMENGDTIRYKMDVIEDNVVLSAVSQIHKSKPTTDLSDYKPHSFKFFVGQDKLKPEGDPLILRFHKETTNVKLISPAKGEDIPNEFLWNLIKQKSIDFKTYVDIMDEVMACNNPANLFGSETIEISEKKERLKNRLPFFGASAYSLLKFSTELYLKKMCGFSNNELANEYFGDAKMLPYIELILGKLKEFDIREKASDQAEEDCFDENEILFSRVNRCLIELIWSYWHEEGMLVQTMNAISLRFQNIRNGTRDPLARLDVDPLRPLNNILWGYIQDTQHRLSIPRRVYEYDHHYGLKLVGNAVPPINSVDSRSKFIEGFHNLLSKCSLYFKDVDDMTRRADGFPVLNSLKEVHLELAEGAHNQFGDLPTTAKAEMLIEQWILSRPEVRDFLGGKVMVPYTEPWMDRVDSMKTIQGWTDTSVSYFSKLARYGEQILLSIRYDNWSEINDALIAGNWAIFWRNEIQQYIHSYFAVTGVDLSAESFGSQQEKFVQPSLLIQRKMEGIIPGRARRFIAPNY